MKLATLAVLLARVTGVVQGSHSPSLCGAAAALRLAYVALPQHPASSPLLTQLDGIA
jgi:hypothetical protein